MKAALQIQEATPLSAKRAARAVPNKVTPRIKVKLRAGENVIDLADVVTSPGSKGAPTVAQQEALIIKYRLKARKLGRSILRRWHSRIDLEEVDSIVDLSLCEAVKRFNPYKGASFMTFMYYHLKGNLVRAVATAATANSIPLFQAPEAFELDRADREHFNGYQFRTMTADEVADALCHQEAPLPDEALWRKEVNDRSSAACDKLDNLEKEIVKRIFVHEQQIMDIAASLGYSRCHISRVKKKALDTLHGELRSEMELEDLGIKKTAELDCDASELCGVADRKAIHRRRPRSRAVRSNAGIAIREAA